MSKKLKPSVAAYRRLKPTGRNIYRNIPDPYMHM